MDELRTWCRKQIDGQLLPGEFSQGLLGIIDDNRLDSQVATCLWNFIEKDDDPHGRGQ